MEPGNGRESDDDEDDDNGVGMEGGLEDEARGVEAKKTKVAAAAFVPGAKRRWSRRRRERWWLRERLTSMDEQERERL